MDLNKIIILGRTTKDPEIRKTEGGANIARFGVATNNKYKDKQGESKEDVEFHNVVAFSKLADIIGQYVKKGQLILIEGRLSTSSWEDKEGNKKYKTEIIAEKMQMGPKKEGGVDKEN